MLLICFFCAVGITYLFRDLFLFFVYRKKKNEFWIYLDADYDGNKAQELLQYYFDLGFSYNDNIPGFVTDDLEFYEKNKDLFCDYGVKLRLL